MNPSWSYEMFVAQFRDKILSGASRESIIAELCSVASSRQDAYSVDRLMLIKVIRELFDLSMQEAIQLLDRDPLCCMLENNGKADGQLTAHSTTRRPTTHPNVYKTATKALRERIRQLVICVSSLPSKEPDLTTQWPQVLAHIGLETMLNAGEDVLALDALCGQLAEYEIRIPQDILREIIALATEVGLDESVILLLKQQKIVNNLKMETELALKR